MQKEKETDVLFPFLLVIIATMFLAFMFISNKKASSAAGCSLKKLNDFSYTVSLCNLRPVYYRTSLRMFSLYLHIQHFHRPGCQLLR